MTKTAQFAIAVMAIEGASARAAATLEARAPRAVSAA